MVARASSKASEKRLRELLASRCHMSCQRDQAGDLLFINLEFFGPSAHFPSSSNNKHAFIPPGWKQNWAPVSHSAATKNRLKVIKEVFAQHLFQTGEGLPQFGEASVYIFAFLADRRKGADGHNFTKPICDWVQGVGIIDNDAQAEAQAKWKREYPDRFSETDSTTVLIMRRELAFTAVSTMVGEVLELANAA